MKAITNTKLILEDGIIFDGTLLFEGDKIIALGKREEIEIPKDAEIIDAKGKYTAPGLIDIHNHGTRTDLFSDEPLKCAEFFVQHGQTTILPTFYCNLTLERMLSGAKKIREVSKSGVGRILDGLYMEGPYMSGKGSNQKSILWDGEIKREEYMPLLDAISDLVRVWAIDPARPGIEGFMKDVKEKNPDAVFALGHSMAYASDCRRVKKYGVKVQTHHSDSGKPAGRCQGAIGSGCDTFTLYDPDMYAELIVDETGIHVMPDNVKMVVRTKGIEKIILITDSMASDGDFKNNEKEGIWYGSDLNYDYEGKLAGSHMTLDNACRNLMTHTGYGLCHAIRCATINPARMLGIDERVGSLEPGKTANLIIIDDQVSVEQVFLQGEKVV